MPLAYYHITIQGSDYKQLDIVKKAQKTTFISNLAKYVTTRYNRLSNRNKHILFIVSVFAIVGLIGLQASRASGFLVSQEAESGTMSGNATKTTDANASGGSAIKFGATTEAVAAPYRFQALTGGNSIAVVWSASTSKISSYEVFRNDVKVATVTPGSGVLGVDKNGRTYIDKAVTAGSQYRYKVRAVASDGRMSDFTPTRTVTHPSSNNTTPIPTVIIDTSKGGADQADFLRTYIIGHIQTWYPKIADAIAYPDFTPLNTIKLIGDPTQSFAAARVWEGEILFSPTFLVTARNGADADGMFLHEATHLLEPYAPTYPSNGAAPWATEGIADWVRDWFTLERVHIPAPNAVLSQNYSEAASMLQWGQEKYATGLVRKVNVALIKENYTTNFFTGLTGGRTADQLYTEMKSQYYGNTGPVVGLASKCMDILNSSPNDGAKLQLFDCNNSNAQKWTISYHDTGLHGNTKKYFSLVNSAIAPNGRCLDVQTAGTASGTIVHSWPCNRGIAQLWTRGANDSLINPNSGKCLSTTGGTSENGNQLIISDCNGSASQRWAIPQ